MPPISAMRLMPPPAIEKPSKNTGYRRATRYTPATTMVAAWISADTGVGPAMASGSQVCSGNWPLLPMMPMNRQIAPARSSPWSAFGLERVLVDAVDAEGAGGEERDDDADHQADVAGAGGEERLERRVGVRALLPPVPDERERAEPDALPADEELQRVLGDDEQQHRRGEQAQQRVVVRVADVAAQVRGRVDVHEQRDERDDEQHHHDEPVDPGADAELDGAVLPPGERVDDRLHDRLGAVPAGFGAEDARGRGAQALAVPARVFDPVDPLDRGDDRQHERRADRGDADLGALVREALPEQQDHDEGRRGDGGDDPGVLEHRRVSPSAGRLRRGRPCARCGR